MHCYIFDYTNAKIYHTTIPITVEDIESYIIETFNMRADSIHFMTSKEELNIEELY